MQIDLLHTMVGDVFNTGRRVLMENEVYTLLKAAGFPHPAHHLVPPGQTINDDFLKSFPGKKVVLKALSPYVLHKSDVGGVAIVEKNTVAVNAAMGTMLDNLPSAFFTWSEEKGTALPEDLECAEDSNAVFEAAVAGVMIAEFVPYSTDFGSELLLGSRYTREFGQVITFGIGGTDAEYFAKRLEPGCGHAIRAAALLDRESALQMIQQTAVFERLSGSTRGTKRRLDDDTLVDAIMAFARLVEAFSPENENAPCLVEELEINPLILANDGRLLAIDGLMRLCPMPVQPLARPVSKIKNLLDARSVALVGVSQKMNVGRIILQNLLDASFPLEHLHIIKPGEKQVAGVSCYENAAALPEKVDLLVLAVSAQQVPDMLEDVCKADCAESVIVIPGGIAEKEGGEAIQERIDRVIAEARKLPGEGPVINGSNCLGIYARETGVNTLFIPEYKLPRPNAEAKSRIAYLSQSGAFMICRMSRISNLDPVYAVSYGNQMDLTIGDYIEHLLDHDGIDLLACYVEGFGDLDGLKVARLAASAKAAGKRIVLYKAGRTAEGQSASAGHTASIAGDYETCRQVLKAAGIELLEIFEDFESCVRLHQAFEGASVGTVGAAALPRIGVISNAGFECVGIADNLKRTVFGQDLALELAQFSSETTDRLQKIFVKGRIDSLVDVKNPLDLTPMANDAIWADCVDALLSDPHVDAAIVSIVPLTAAMQTLPSSDAYGEDLLALDGICARLAEVKTRFNKPFVVAVDSGHLYDPMVQRLEEIGIPVFAFSDQATRFLAKALK